MSQLLIICYYRNYRNKPKSFLEIFNPRPEIKGHGHEFGRRPGYRKKTDTHVRSSLSLTKWHPLIGHPLWRLFSLSYRRLRHFWPDTILRGTIENFLIYISPRMRPQITRSTSWSSKINQNDRRVVVNDSITSHVLLFCYRLIITIYWMLYKFGWKVNSLFSGILKHLILNDRLYLSNTHRVEYDCTHVLLKICVWYAYQCKFTRV